MTQLADLIGFWDFRRRSGTTISNLGTGTSIDATINGSMPAVDAPGVWFPGTSGNYLRIMDEEGFGFISDMEIVVSGDDLTGGAVGNETLVARWTGSGGTLAWESMLLASSGYPFFRWSTDGTATLSANSGVVLPSSARWLRIQFDGDDGAGNRETIFEYSTADPSGAEPVTWTAHATVLTAGTTSIANIDADVTIGSNAAAATPLAATLRRVILRSGRTGATPPPVTVLDWQAPDLAKTNSVDILFVGDSITEGVGCDITTTLEGRWSAQVIAALNGGVRQASRGTLNPLATTGTAPYVGEPYVAGTTTGQGYVPTITDVNNTGYYDSHEWTVVSGSPADNVIYGLGRRSIDLSSGDSIERDFTGDAVDVVFARVTSAGAVEVQIDGAIPQTISTAPAPNAGGGFFRRFNLEAGDHTIRITHSAGNTATISGIMVYAADTGAGYRLWDGAKSGYTAQSFAANKTWMFGCRSAVPDIIIYALGVNDYRGDRTAAEFEADTDTIIGAFRTGVETRWPNTAAQITPYVPIILARLYEPQDGVGGAADWADYLTALNNVAANYDNVSVIDVEAVVDPIPLIDTLHPNQVGHDLIADALLTVIPEVTVGKSPKLRARTGYNLTPVRSSNAALRVIPEGSVVINDDETDTSKSVDIADSADFTVDTDTSAYMMFSFAPGEQPASSTHYIATNYSSNAGFALGRAAGADTYAVTVGDGTDTAATAGITIIPYVPIVATIVFDRGGPTMTLRINDGATVTTASVDVTDIDEVNSAAGWRLIEDLPDMMSAMVFHTTTALPDSDELEQLEDSLLDQAVPVAVRRTMTVADVPRRITI